MFIKYDPDEWETIVEHGPHGYSYTQRRRPAEEVYRIKADRMRKEEDEILMKAKIIIAARALRGGR